MALENNAICDICGKPYHVCQTCKDITSFKPWRTVTDTFPHYMIFLAISDYTRTKDKQKAKEALFDSIKKYPGVVIIISHEKDFYDDLVDLEIHF